MDTKFGFRGTIVPVQAFKGHKEFFHFGSFQISIEESVFEIGYDDDSLAAEAQSVAARYLSALGFATDRPFSLELNQSWKKHSDGTEHIAISLSDKIHVTDDIRMTVSATIEGKAKIVQVYDSRNVNNETELVRKSFKDPALGKALQYFSEEVVGDDRPLYGVYKAMEALAKALAPRGREKLAGLIGQGNNYVREIMETAQTVRHHDDPNARSVITEQECRERARALILAYANSIKL